MQTSDNGISLIKAFEGFSAHPYKDVVGIWTIGYGSTRINGKPVTSSTSIITESRATDLLKDDVRQTEKDISRLIKVKITQNQFDALVSFVYNVGIGNFTSSTMLKLINQGGGNSDAVAEQFRRWNKAGGKPVLGLTRRRAAEESYFRSGDLDEALEQLK